MKVVADGAAARRAAFGRPSPLGRGGMESKVDAADWTADPQLMERLDQWCTTGRIDYDTSELQTAGAVSPAAAAIAAGVLAEIRRKRVLALMLGFSAAIALWAFEFGKDIAGLDRGAQQELERARDELTQLRSQRDKAQAIASHRAIPKVSFTNEVATSIAQER